MLKQEFTCNICLKSFSNKQKLGGHKGSHNRYKGMMIKSLNISYDCLNCEKDITGEARRTRKRLYCNIECMKQYRLKNTFIYGVSLLFIEEYRKLHPVCEICGLPEKAIHASDGITVSKLSIDHGHRTGKFRGLLCSSCNRNLGWAENKVEKIESYLSKNNGL